MNPSPRKSILLLSGGMDSTTLLWWMRDRGISEIHTVSVDYGQRHAVELESSATLSRMAGATSHRCLKLDLRQFGGNPLTDTGHAVPAAKQGRQTLTVVPFRNMLFVTLAAAWAEVKGCGNLYLSPVRNDFEIYRDCRREFYDMLEKTLCLGASRQTDYRIHTPFVEKWKDEVVSLGLEPGRALRPRPTPATKADAPPAAVATPAWNASPHFAPIAPWIRCPTKSKSTGRDPRHPVE